MCCRQNGASCCSVSNLYVVCRSGERQALFAACSRLCDHLPNCFAALNSVVFYVGCKKIRRHALPVTASPRYLLFCNTRLFYYYTIVYQLIQLKISTDIFNAVKRGMTSRSTAEIRKRSEILHIVFCRAGGQAVESRRKPLETGRVITENRASNEPL